MVDYKKLLKEFKTPLYVYDCDELESRIKFTKSKLKECKIVYAIKANTFIVREIDPFVDKFEICSPGEFYICKNININYTKMVISGVNKEKRFIEELISNYDIGRYTIESLEHYNILNELSLKYKKKIDVLIRLTSGNQFGISEDDFKYILKNINNKYMNIVGIEYFSGTQKSIKKIEHEIDYLNEFLSSIETEFGFIPQEVEYGPGLKVEYYEEVDDGEYLDEVEANLKRLNAKSILIESGRFLTASCGSYLTSVVDMKTNQNGNFVIVDGGINHLVYYGSTLAMKTPPFEVLNNSSKELLHYNIYGSLCTINDVLMKNVEVGKLDVGDVFVFKKTGAYSSTEGISLFLSRDLPKVIIKKGSNNILVRDIISTSDLNSPIYERSEV